MLCLPHRLLSSEVCYHAVKITGIHWRCLLTWGAGWQNHNTQARYKDKECVVVQVMVAVVGKGTKDCLVVVVVVAGKIKKAKDYIPWAPKCERPSPQTNFSPHLKRRIIIHIDSSEENKSPNISNVLQMLLNVNKSCIKQLEKRQVSRVCVTVAVTLLQTVRREGEPCWPSWVLLHLLSLHLHTSRQPSWVLLHLLSLNSHTSRQCYHRVKHE